MHKNMHETTCTIHLYPDLTLFIRRSPLLSTAPSCWPEREHDPPPPRHPPRRDVPIRRPPPLAIVVVVLDDDGIGVVSCGEEGDCHCDDDDDDDDDLDEQGRTPIARRVRGRFPPPPARLLLHLLHLFRLHDLGGDQAGVRRLPGERGHVPLQARIRIPQPARIRDGIGREAPTHVGGRGDARGRGTGIRQREVDGRLPQGGGGDYEPGLRRGRRGEGGAGGRGGGGKARSADDEVSFAHDVVDDVRFYDASLPPFCIPHIGQ